MTTQTLKQYTWIFLLFLAAQSLSAQQRLVSEEQHLPNVAMTVGMTHDLSRMLSFPYAQTLLPIDTAAQTGQLPTFSDSIYAERLHRLPTIIPMPYNEQVAAYIRRYTSELRPSISFFLGVQNFYLPIFEAALEAEGLPLELKYLPMVESALDPSVSSVAGAAGLWQFTTKTGKAYGLELNSLVDERRDPIKSTTAAVRHLKKLYQRFGDWHLALAAYNCGENNVEKAIKRSQNQRNYWNIYEQLPKETRGYVPAFIAMNYVMYYYCEHKIPTMHIENPVETDTVMVGREMHFQQIAERCGVEQKMIEMLNPQYRRSIIPAHSAKAYSLRLPTLAIAHFVEQESEIAAHRANELLDRSSSTELGYRIAVTEPAYNEQHSTETAVSKNAAERHRGQQQEKQRKQRVQERQESRSKKSKKREKTITIQQGDNLASIAERNGMTVKALKKLNKISGNNIRAGKKIRVK